MKRAVILVVVLFIAAMAIVVTETPYFREVMVYRDLDEAHRDIYEITDFRSQCWTDYGPILVNWNRHITNMNRCELFEVYNKETRLHKWMEPEKIGQYLFE